MTTGFVFHEAFLAHDTGPSHPECAARLSVLANMVSVEPGLTAIEPREAERDRISRIHSERYIDHVRDVCVSAPAYLDSGDTPVSPESWKAALLASGAVLTGIDGVCAGRISNCFCAVRPPGHHALREAAMGFCLFNNIAMGAKYAQEHHSIERVLIVDWDVHHGNGTQDAFYDDGTVLFFSIHRYPFYPGSGSDKERGEGEGMGSTINCPVRGGSGDDEYVEVFEKILVPAADEFRPGIVLVSAGFDAYVHDPLGGMAVNPEGFGMLTRIVRDIANRHCGGRIVSVLEGGYDINGLAGCVREHLRGLKE